MATFAGLIMKLAVDRSAYSTGLRGARADADDFATGVERSMGRAGQAATAAADRIAAAQAAISAANKQQAAMPAVTSWQGGPAMGGATFHHVQVGADQASTSVQNLNSHLDHTGVLLASFAGLAFVHFLQESVSEAANFEQAMLGLHTQARATMAEVRLMTDSVIEMAPAVRTGPEELARGLYHIESVGIRGARALKVLEVSAQGARVGMADMEAVTNALVGALATGIKGVEDLEGAMGTLDAIVGTGNMTMEELARSFSSGILATAKTFGISMQDVGAALATMTDQAIPAREASTRLRMTIALLGAPTRQAANELSRLGLSSTALAEEMSSERGLLGALTLLKTRLDSSGMSAEQQAALLVRAFGGGRSSSGIMTLLGSLNLMDQKLHVINETAGKFPELVAAQAQTAAARFQELQAVVGVLSIQLGNALLPVLTGVASVLTVFVGNTEAMTVALSALAALLGVKVAMVVAGFIKSMIASTVAIIGKTGAMVGLTTATVAYSASTGAATGATFGLTAAGAALLAVLGPLAVAAGAVAVAYAAVSGEIDKQADALTKQTSAYVMAKSTTDEMLASAKQLVEAQMELAKKPMIEGGAMFGGIDVYGAVDKLQRQWDIIDAEQQTRALQAGHAADLGLAAGFDGEEFLDKTRSLVEVFGQTVGGVKQAAQVATADAMSAMRRELEAGRDAPQAAFANMLDSFESAMTPMEEIALNVGILADQRLAEALESNIPSVVAAAEAVRLSAQERLDELTQGAYTAGTQAVDAYQRALETARTGYYMPEGSVGLLTKEYEKEAAALKTQWERLKPSANAVADAIARMNRELEETRRSSAAVSELNSAFGQIRQAAHQYFDMIHRNNLKAIDDTLRHKNALLDAKSALNQGPVTAAQRALDFQRQKQEEFRLRERVAEARTAEEKRDAILALEDFLAQVRINEMQDQVDAAQTLIDAQKDANERRAQAQRDAENERYRMQQQDFDRQLELLRRYLEKHPGEWTKTNEKVLALLKAYGMDYKGAGNLLGQSFVDGLREQVEAAEEAARELARAGAALPQVPPKVPEPGKVASGTWEPTAPPTGAPDASPPMPAPAPPPPPTGGSGGGAIYHLQSGMWDVLYDNLQAVLHSGEMVAPPDVSQLLRTFGSRRIDKKPDLGAMRSTVSESRGGDTIVFQVGDERWGEFTDKKLALEDRLHGGSRQVSTGLGR